MVHALVVATTVSVIVPYLSEGAFSRLQIFVTVIGIVVAYFLLAIIWGARHVVFLRGSKNSVSDRDAGMTKNNE